MTTFLWREKILNVPRSLSGGFICYDLGPLKAGLRLRVPIIFANWLFKRDALRTCHREEAELRFLEAERRRLAS